MDAELFFPDELPLLRATNKAQEFGYSDLSDLHENGASLDKEAVRTELYTSF